MALARSEQGSEVKHLEMEEHPASVVNYLSFLNSILQANNIRDDSLNNNHEVLGRDQDGERKAKKRRLGHKFAWRNTRGLERHRKPPENPAGFLHQTSPTPSDWELPKSDETSEVFKFQVTTKPAKTDPELLPFLFPAGQSLAHLYSYYAKIILQVQLQQQQIHQQRQVLEHLFANRSEVGCHKRQPERPSGIETHQNYKLKVRKKKSTLF